MSEGGVPRAANGRLRGALGGLRRPDIRDLALQGYRRERIERLSFPIAMAVMEGGFVGVIADKMFHVHPAVIALISAAPMFGNLSSFVWARVAHGRRKIPIIVALQVAFIAFVALVTLIPADPLGAWLLVGALIVARQLLGGVVTLRSLVWTLNYRRAVRGRVTARLSVLATLAMTLTSIVGSLLLDANPESFRALYASSALVAALGTLAFSGIELIGESGQLALERQDDAEASDASSPSGGGRARERVAGPGILHVLREDANFTRYLSWQFLLGVSNMMVEAPLIYLVSRQLQASYTESVAITMAIPLGLSVVTIPLWAAYIDRVHISEFRSRHSWLFAASQLVLWLGAVQGSLFVIAVSRVIVGFARGGGMLAWQLGHNDFADQDRVGLYMGIHVTLTGLRGLFAPFAGMLLYVGWSARQIPGFDLALPGFAGIGAHVMLASWILGASACLGFVALHRRMSQH